MLTYNYDQAARISNAAGELAPELVKNYASSFAYAPHGAVSQLTLGNELVEKSTYNNRLQPLTMGLGASATNLDKLGLTFTYGTNNNNGNILTQAIAAPSFNATQNYRYDPLNRLAIAAEGAAPVADNGCPAGAAWCRDYDYDRYGNRAVIDSPGMSPKQVTPASLADFDPATNRITMLNTAYDLAGNLTTTHLSETLLYDAENRQTSYTGSASSGTYFYDGGGNRVKKVSTESGTTTTQIFVYDAFGKLAAEYSDRAPSSPGTHYRTIDHLGSTRLVTDQNQVDKARYDLLPFGEEIFDTIGGRAGVEGYTNPLDDRHKFTGKERDSESGMDYFLARYYSGPMGRFLSVDPESAGARPADPQTWNAFAYGANSPLKFVDPDGREIRVTYHRVPVPFFTQRHTAVRIIPNNQEKYKDNENFSNETKDGKRFAVLSAEPESPGISVMVDKGTLLKGKNNKPSDTVKQEGSVKVEGVGDEDEKIDALFEAASNYEENGLNTNQLYQLKPDPNDEDTGYNSNSYTSGLLNSVGLTAPKLPTDKPVSGYDVPVPASAFQKPPEENEQE